MNGTFSPTALQIRPVAQSWWDGTGSGLVKIAEQIGQIAEGICIALENRSAGESGIGCRRRIS